MAIEVAVLANGAWAGSTRVAPVSTDPAPSASGGFGAPGVSVRPDGRLQGDGTAGASSGTTVGRRPTDDDVKESPIVAHPEQSAEEAQKTFFRITDNIPEEAWYWAALGSIGVSALLKLAEKDDWAIFVGQWPPTFLLFGLYHRLLRPSRQ